MFSYKGIDKDYNYKRGNIEATDEIEAISKIKAEEDILIIVNLKKASKNKFVNNIKESFGAQSVNLENRIMNYNRRVNEEKRQREEKKKQKKLNPENSLANKSPILKAVKKVTDKLPSRKRKYTIDEETYNNLQNMFRSQGSQENGNNNAEIIITNELSENKISDVKESNKEMKKDEKAINWDLIDNEDSDDPEIKKNLKIKVKEKEIIMFTRRLHIMLSSGVSLLSSLTLLQETSSKKLSYVLRGVLDDIERGSTFSEAISKYPRQFNYAYVSLVAIGETSGSLDKSLSDIIKLKEQEQRVKRKVRTASIYPAFVGFFLTLMMLAATLFFLPKFDEMYQEQELPIPSFTKTVFGIAGVLPYIIITITLAFVILTFIRRRSPRINHMYRKRVDRMLLKFPILKGIMNAMYMHSFSSTISLMLDNGIRLSDTLSLTGKTINNIYIKNEIEDVGQLMTHGLTFSEALREQKHFDTILVNIALTGEESGKMVFSLAQVADYFEIELNKKVDAMMEAVPPLSIAIIALLAAPVIIAAYLPILEISTGTGLGL